ncbi:GLPGLI family protein [Croceitalea marina]|uniref:GLPGLI family protein n=1 Tax=Croceitalea marina TaxID=1775166 RepID=A0ABW5MWV8_9FLAO
MKNTFYAFMILLSIKSFAQDFTGSAIYKTDMKMELKMDSTETSANQMDMIQEQLRFAMQKDFELTFNKTESNWRELEKLDKPAVASGMNVQIQIVGNGGGSDGLLYKNTKTKKSLESTDAFGKLFLVADELEPVEWEMTSETKQIGKYTCYKAISKREVTETVFSDVNGESEEKKEKRMQTTTVWYTPEIPVNHGPERYWGLPGLILEVSNGRRIMICTQVVLNPEKPVTIEIPSKGKKVDGEEYEAIMKEHAEKMNKMYGGGKKKGQHSSFEIRIGG